MDIEPNVGASTEALPNPPGDVPKVDDPPNTEFPPKVP